MWLPALALNHWFTTLIESAEQEEKAGWKVLKVGLSLWQFYQRKLLEILELILHEQQIKPADTVEEIEFILLILAYKISRNFISTILLYPSSFPQHDKNIISVSYVTMNENKFRKRKHFCSVASNSFKINWALTLFSRQGTKCQPRKRKLCEINNKSSWDVKWRCFCHQNSKYGLSCFKGSENWLFWKISTMKA